MCAVRSHVKRGLVLILPVHGIKQARFRPSGTKLRERRACPRPSGMTNLVGGTSSVRYKVDQKEDWSLSVWYEE